MTHKPSSQLEVYSEAFSRITALASLTCSFKVFSILLPPVLNRACHFFSPLFQQRLPTFLSSSLNCCSLNTQRKSSNRLSVNVYSALVASFTSLLSEIFICGMSIELLLNFVRTGLLLPPSVVSCPALMSGSIVVTVLSFFSGLSYSPCGSWVKFSSCRARRLL